MLYCKLYPSIKDNENQPSKLFKDLLAFSGNNREFAIDVYSRIRGSKFEQEFLPSWGKENLDEFGEPTIKSVVERFNLTEQITAQSVIKALSSEISKDGGYYEEDSEEAINRKVETAIKFNRNSQYKDGYVALIDEKIEDGKALVGVKIVKKTNDTAKEAHDMAVNNALYKKLTSILNDMGISVGALDEVRSRMGISASTDFSSAKTLANGCIELIKIAKGYQGRQYLPEEFSHLIIETMLEHPIVKRLVNTIQSKNIASKYLTEEELQSYRDKGYNDFTIAKEVAGRMLMKQLISTTSENIDSSYKPILDRSVNATRSEFGSKDESVIQNAIIEAEAEFNDLAKQILQSALTKNIRIQDIKETIDMYHLDPRLERLDNHLSKIIEVEVKKLNIYRHSSKGEEFKKNQKAIVNNLKLSILQNLEIQGAVSYMQDAIHRLQQLNSKLATLSSDNTSTIEEKSRILRNTRNYYSSYVIIQKELLQMVNEESKEVDSKITDELRNLIVQFNDLLALTQNNYTASAMPVFVEFMSPYFTPEILDFLAKKAGRKSMTVEDVIRYSESDISGMSRWLDSAAESYDVILKIYDKIVKNAKENARLDAQEVARELKAAGIELENAGISDFEWMFERDFEGNLTGNYISKYNWGQYEKEKKKMLKALKEKYQNKNGKIVGQALVDYKKEKSKWYSDNLKPDPTDNTKSVPIDKYLSTEYSNLMTINSSDNIAKRKFFKKVMDIKKELDSYLPAGRTRLNNAVKIRKDFSEQVLDSEGNIISNAVERIKDKFLVRSDDIDLAGEPSIQAEEDDAIDGDGEVLKDVRDFEDRKVNSLGVYYINLKEGESPNDISQDVVSTMINYADMALKYREMNKVVNSLENGIDMMQDNRRVQQKSAGKKLKESYSLEGVSVTNPATTPFLETNIGKRTLDFMNIQVYNHTQEVASILNGKVSLNKVVSNLNFATSLYNIGFNIFGGVANIQTGHIQELVEAVGGQYFTFNDFIVGSKDYMTDVLGYIADIGQRVKTHKMSLIFEEFDIMQDYDKDPAGNKFARKTLLTQMGFSDFAYFHQNLGEHMLHGQTFYAMARKVRFKKKNGESGTISLTEALEVEYLDPTNHNKGARLKIKDGYVKENGEEWTRADVIKFTKKVAAVNQKMHGIYNKQDAMALQTKWWGNFFILYRKWIKPFYNRRFDGKTYNFDTETWTEGYYATVGRMIMETWKDVRHGQSFWAALQNKKNALTQEEKENFKRVMTDIGIFIAISVGAEYYDPDDDDYIGQANKYFLLRQRTEVSAGMPGTNMLKDILKMVNSPVVGLDTLQKWMAVLDATFDMDTVEGALNITEDDVIKSGPFKGYTRLQRALLRAAPGFMTYRKILDPAIAATYYNK